MRPHCAAFGFLRLAAFCGFLRLLRLFGFLQHLQHFAALCDLLQLLSKTLLHCSGGRVTDWHEANNEMTRIFGPADHIPENTFKIGNNHYYDKTEYTGGETTYAKNGHHYYGNNFEAVAGPVGARGGHSHDAGCNNNRYKSKIL